MKLISTHLLFIIINFAIQNAFTPLNNKITSTKKNYDSWILIGKSIIEASENANTVIKAFNSQKIKKIRVLVIKGGLNLKKCEVWLIDGSKKTIELRNDISVGEESREIVIDKNPAIVDKIILNYDTRNHTSSHSEFELWGKAE